MIQTLLDNLIKLLLANPLLLLFVVAAIGYPVGRIKIAGGSLGVGAVLFAGIAVGALDKDLQLPAIVYELGLVLFVYCVGLSNGPVFFASLRRKGLRDNLFVLALLVFAAVLAAAVHFVFGIKATLTAGMYAGSLTNTPALAGVIEYLRIVTPENLRAQMLAEPVVGYSIAYPIGIIGMIVTMNVLQRMWKIDYAAEARSLSGMGATNQDLVNRTVCVTRPEATRETIHQLVHDHGWDVIIGRVRREGRIFLVDGDKRLQLGDVVSVIGTAEALEQAIAYLGEGSDEQLSLDRTEFDYRRMFVSNPRVASHRLRELNLPQLYGAVVTRLRRGDVEFIPHGDTVLELGDRVRVVTKRENMDTLSKFFGDSYRALSEIDVLTFSLGLALGLVVGTVPIPLPGGIVVKLGIAGGPLIVALILGTLGRTGSMVWNLPYSANLVLRQIGLILFLAGIGTRAGYTFGQTLTQGGGLVLLLAGAAITCLTAVTAMWIGYHILKIPMSLLTGMVAGMQTQPAVLGFATDQTNNELPNIGYASVYPVALIGKIVLAQILIMTMS